MAGGPKIALPSSLQPRTFRHLSGEEEEDDDNNDDYMAASNTCANWSKSIPKKKQALKQAPKRLPKRAPKKQAPNKPAPLLCCAGDLCKQQEGCIIIDKGLKCVVYEGHMHGFSCSDEKVQAMVGMTCKNCALTNQKGRTSRIACGWTPPLSLSRQTKRGGGDHQQQPKAIAVPKDPLPTRRSARNK